jgi:hypothetical protein
MARKHRGPAAERAKTVATTTIVRRCCISSVSMILQEKEAKRGISHKQR